MGRNTETREDYTIDDLVYFVRTNDFLFPRLLGEESASQESIDEFERMLDVKLPEDYRRFLNEFGYLIYHGRDYYGICYDDPHKFDFADNAADLTLRLREESALPHYYVAFYDDEGDEQWCFDVREPHSNVIAWDYFNQCVAREYKTDFVNTIFNDIVTFIDTNDDAIGKEIKWPEKRS